MAGNAAARGARNGLPERRDYTYRGIGRSLTDCEASRRLRVLDVHEAIDGPGPEWYRELRQEADDDLAAPITGRVLPPTPAPHLATSKELRAATPVPQVIRLRPAAAPLTLDGQRRFWRGPMPPALAERVTAARQSAPAAGDGRCGRCGYLLARCCCPGGPRGGAR